MKHHPCVNRIIFPCTLDFERRMMRKKKRFIAKSGTLSLIYLSFFTVHANRAHRLESPTCSRALYTHRWHLMLTFSAMTCRHRNFWIFFSSCRSRTTLSRIHTRCTTKKGGGDQVGHGESWSLFLLVLESKNSKKKEAPEKHNTSSFFCSLPLCVSIGCKEKRERERERERRLCLFGNISTQTTMATNKERKGDAPQREDLWRCQRSESKRVG
jgi:hypothetical protein